MRQRSKVWFFNIYFSFFLPCLLCWARDIQAFSFWCIMWEFFFLLYFSFFFFLIFSPMCWDIISSNLLFFFTGVSWATGEAWCKRTEGQVGLRRGREAVWGIAQTSYIEAASLNSPSCLLSFMILLLNHCKEDKVSAWSEVPPKVMWHHSGCSLILWKEGYSFLTHAQCLPSSNWGTAGARDCPSMSFIWDFKLIFGKAEVLCQVLDLTSTETVMAFWGKVLQCLIINSLLNYRVNKTKKPPQPVHLIKKIKQSTAFSLTGFGVLTLQHWPPRLFLG